MIEKVGRNEKVILYLSIGFIRSGWSKPISFVVGSHHYYFTGRMMMMVRGQERRERGRCEKEVQSGVTTRHIQKWWSREWAYRIGGKNNLNHYYHNGSFKPPEFFAWATLYNNSLHYYDQRTEDSYSLPIFMGTLEWESEAEKEQQWGFCCSADRLYSLNRHLRIFWYFSTAISTAAQQEDFSFLGGNGFNSKTWDSKTVASIQRQNSWEACLLAKLWEVSSTRFEYTLKPYFEAILWS